MRFGLNYVPKSVSSTLYPAGAGYFSSHVGGGGGGGGVGFDPSVLVMKINYSFWNSLSLESNFQNLPLHVTDFTSLGYHGAPLNDQLHDFFHDGSPF